MERVAFLIEATGERISCLLNPESITFQRRAGLRQRRDRGGILTAGAVTDDPLIATGGGVTELTLNLLFDTGIADSLRPGPHHAATDPYAPGADPAAPPATPLPMRSVDVRALTRPFWNLSENAEPGAGPGGPPVVRFICGRTWNVPGVIVAVAERLERFGQDGAPQRSWMTLRLRRVADTAAPGALAPSPVTPQQEFPAAPDPSLLEQAPRIEVLADEDGRPATRLDLVASEQLGTPFDWPRVAAASGIDDPLRIEAGTVLVVPVEQPRVQP